jgi:hypothetical protein
MELLEHSYMEHFEHVEDLEHSYMEHLDRSIWSIPISAQKTFVTQTQKRDYPINWEREAFKVH